MTTTSYKVLSSFSIENLEAQVENHLYNEYKLIGGVSVTYTPDGLLFNQAIYREEESYSSSLELSQFLNG